MYLIYKTKTYMKKFKEWLKTAGIRSIVYLIAGVVLLILGFKFLAGIGFGIFGTDNFVTIKNLIKKGKEFVETQVK